MSSTLEADFQPLAASAGAARRLVRNRLSDVTLDRPELLDLLVSELVTNAILHARTVFTVTVELLSTVVRISATDRNSALPALRSTTTTSITGRGLHVISENSVRWGVDPTAHGKTVWFELALVTAHGEGQGSR
jgi:anti-sigma regulatory factor (Ser/Thr protein kinase)